jgi:hypothetical protein
MATKSKAMEKLIDSCLMVIIEDEKLLEDRMNWARVGEDDIGE